MEVRQAKNVPEAVAMLALIEPMMNLERKSRLVIFDFIFCFLFAEQNIG